MTRQREAPSEVLRQLWWEISAPGDLGCCPPAPRCPQHPRGSTIYSFFIVKFL